MKHIKCICGQPECKKEIWLEWNDSHYHKDYGCLLFWATSKDGSDTLIYLNEGEVAELIRGLKHYYLSMIDEDVTK